MSRLGSHFQQAIVRGRKPANAVAKRWSAGVLIMEQETPTRFDSLVAELGIADQPEAWAHHPRVRRFVYAHYKRRYVPDWLLKLWGLDGEANLCA